MKRKIFSQISLLLAIFAIAISLSACNTSTSTSASGNASSSNNYTQGATQNSDIPSPQTKQS